MTLAEIERALDAGKLQMMRPWGDWVTVRRRSDVTASHAGYVPIYMENQVEACIAPSDERMGFPLLRIVRKQAA
jgi:hypothetical protein